MDELVKGCVEQDRLSQHKLYLKHSKTLFKVCLRYTKSREEAEEVLSEGFVLIFKKIHQYNGTGCFEGWMRKIMVNAALERLRKVGDRINKVELIEARDGYKETTIDRLNAKELMKLIQKLPPKSQTVFNLYVFENYTHEEIAKELKISIGTSKFNLNYARNWLQQHIKKQNGNYNIRESKVHS